MNKTVLQQELAEQPYPLLFVTVSGAHLYGFASPDSDFDLRGIHLLPYEQLLGLQSEEETRISTTIRSGVEIDLVTNDLKKFIKMMLGPNGYILEQLYSPLLLRSGPEHEELKFLGKGCITRGHVNHYRGFAKNQWKLFQREEPRRVKPLLYIFRVLLTGIHLMRTGEVEAHLPTLLQEIPLAYIPELIELKQKGEEQCALPACDESFYESEYNRLLTQLEEESLKSSLPEEPSASKALNDFLIRVRLQRTVIPRENPC